MPKFFFGNNAMQNASDQNYVSRTNVTIILTWYSVILPFSTRTCCSFIQAAFTFRSVLAARVIPCWIASSKLLVDVELISEIFATDMVHLPKCDFPGTIVDPDLPNGRRFSPGLYQRPFYPERRKCILVIFRRRLVQYDAGAGWAMGTRH